VLGIAEQPIIQHTVQERASRPNPGPATVNSASAAGLSHRIAAQPLGTDHGINRAGEHEYAVGDGQRPTAATLPGYHAGDGDRRNCARDLACDAVPVPRTSPLGPRRALM
jgi:hypothetical protein